jgi:putative transcriptional regulator
MRRILLASVLMVPMAFLVGLSANLMRRGVVRPVCHLASPAADLPGQASPMRERAMAHRLPASENSQLAAGKFLVARRDLPDPFFAETVILLLQYDKNGALGLIVNRPTGIPVSRLLRDLEAARQRKDPVYLGGPVSPGGVLALLRSGAKLGDARHVFADVYLVSSRQALEKAVSDRAEPSALRIYMGYSGWAPGQLDGEMRLRTWHIFQGDPELVFHPDPESVWPRLIRRTELIRALAPRPPTAPIPRG